MCGIAGIALRDGVVEPLALARMAAAIRHRGPDGYGFLADGRIGLAHTRLRILDLERGAQPLANEDERLWITFNGEIYNWRDLRAELSTLGHRFRTSTDTEVIVHAWERWGPAALDRFNGQFAFGLYDRRDGSLVLARDRFGIRPLYYALTPRGLVFGSEAKALFASGELTAAVNPAGLDDVFTVWAPQTPTTVFRGVQQLPPGTWARWDEGRLTETRWWEPGYPEARDEPADALERLDHLLRAAVATRMRADVPVGGYLSGGLDSSITCALAVEHTPQALRTFSVTFADPALDESPHQEAVARAIASRHAIQRIGHDEIARVFPDVVRHAETPLLRTAPAPMFLLSKLARDHGITVVLSGEGSDEVFLGYDLFREAELRRFCLRQPGSSVRPRLFDRLYPYLRNERGGELWRRFFLEAARPGDPLFSHQPRMRLASFVREFYGEALREPPRPGADERLRQALPPAFGSWSTLAQAAYLEVRTLLEGYLLSSQGDRVALAHGLEARYPFLDHHVFEFAAALPSRSKLAGLREKAILRRWARGVIPPAVLERPKQPYRAPDIPAFYLPEGPPDYVDALLAAPALRASGLFDPAAVEGLVRRCRAGRATGVRESQALVGILSAQIWHSEFVGGWTMPVPLTLEGADVLWGPMNGVRRRVEA